MALTSMRFARDGRLQRVSDNNPPMKRGEKGEPVATVQRALIDLGFAMPITTAEGTKLPDGIFGTETEQVVRTFQRQNGLSADGIVGRDTMRKLEQLTAALTLAKKAELATTPAASPQSPTDHRTLRR
jgi:peptidoglycan hydrolase-like protein with peptidoglycan-binding domain